jgi:hypothetical protein
MNESMCCYGYLPIEPTIFDLMKYSRIRLRKKRFKKKFIKNYIKYIPEVIYKEYLDKVTHKPIMTYASLGGIVIGIKQDSSDSYIINN